MKKRVRSKKLDVLNKMPPLYHKLPNKEFNVEESEVLNWISFQSELLDWLRGYAKDAGYIVYDSETGKWQGVNYSDD
ncbi:hypothetical protein P7G51_08050 [Enterococcus asini]|uniref:hypothetical protein n=1 Tax=Enterococcus asini TaxID=57732 RepID=UPI00288EAB74|nr:hypothetical protein [Enterococcus asini]MDT2757331.1 hypothetical protein [Enterococcus asini]